MLAQESTLDVRRHDQETIDPALHRAQRGGGFVGVAVRAGNQKVQSMRARRKVDAADQLGEEFAEQVRQQRAHRLGAAGDQAARRAQRHIAQACDRPLDARARCRGDLGSAIQCP